MIPWIHAGSQTFAEERSCVPVGRNPQDIIADLLDVGGIEFLEFTVVNCRLIRPLSVLPQDDPERVEPERVGPQQPLDPLRLLTRDQQARLQMLGNAGHE